MTRISRRDFMYDTAWLAAATAGLSVGAGRACAADADPAPRVPAGDKLRVAVIGVRGQGMAHVTGYAGKHNCVITTICDVDSAVIGPAMKHVETTQGKAPAYVKDLRKVIDDKEIDLISIATPNHWHALAAIWGLQAGKDVYVEKPVSHNVSEGRRIVEAARKHKRICQTGTQSRSQKGMREALAFIHGGKIGKVKLARGLCYKLRPSIGKVDGPQKPPETMDYDLWCGPAPLKMPHRKTKNGTVHYDWHWVWDYGNGDLGNQGIHEMDKARWGLQKNTLPKSIMCVGGRFGYVDDGETPNTQVILFDYGDCELVFEVRGMPSASPYPGSKSPKSESKPSNFVGNVWYGSEGFVVCPSYSSGVAYSNDGEVLKEFGGGGDHFGNFVAAVRSRKSSDLHADILEGHLSSALCHLGNISYRLGTPETFARKPEAFATSKEAAKAMADMVGHLKTSKVDVGTIEYRYGRSLTFDPTAEKFGEPDADALLTREYRKGFEVPAKV